MASIIKASNHLRCSLKEPGSRRAKSDATHDWKNANAYSVLLSVVELGSRKFWLDHRLTMLEVVDLFVCRVNEPIWEGAVWEPYVSRIVYAKMAYRTEDGRYRIVLNNSHMVRGC